MKKQDRLGAKMMQNREDALRIPKNNKMLKSNWPQKKKVDSGYGRKFFSSKSPS